MLRLVFGSPPFGEPVLVPPSLSLSLFLFWRLSFAGNIEDDTQQQEQRYISTPVYIYMCVCVCCVCPGA